MGKLILEVFGAVTGLLYVYLEIRHRRSMWLVGLIMAVCYMVVFGTERLYASAALYLYYFIISIYGWFRWRGAGESQGPEASYLREGTVAFGGHAACNLCDPLADNGPIY